MHLATAYSEMSGSKPIPEALGAVMSQLLQVEMEYLYNKNQLIERLTEELESSDYPFEQKFKEWFIPYNFGIYTLVQLMLHKRADISTLVGIVRKSADSVYEAANLLVKMAEVNFIDYDGRTRQFITKAQISEELQRELDIYQFPLPMVCKPRKVRTNQENGYITFGSSIILRDSCDERDVCLDHINRVNRIPFSINLANLTNMKNTWRGLSKPKPCESLHEFKQRLSAFNKYDSSSHWVIGQMIKADNKFYLTHRYDKRGRTYSMGYHINYQGNDWNKAVIELHQKEII